MKKALYILIVGIGMFSCSKKSSNGPAPDDVTNRLNFIIDDNKFNFSFFNAGLSRTPYRIDLAQKGPYTVLVPDNNAFIAAGYSNEQAVLTQSGDLLNNMIPYHISYGLWELNKLPFTFNQEIESVTGAKMYVTRWVKNTDTLVTINGTKVKSYNLKASNGLIQVINAVLQPLVYKTLSQAIASDKDLTYLNVALQRSGLQSAVASADSIFTVFAPTNAAFIAAGYATIQDVNNADPATLRETLAYNMFKGRKFIYDYVLTTDATDKNQQAMYSGNNINVSLVRSGVDYSGITIKGIGNTVAGNIVRSNVLAGNGVMHMTDLLLKETL